VRLVSFKVNGHHSWGTLDSEGISDLGARHVAPSLCDHLISGADTPRNVCVDYKLGDVELTVPVSGSRIFCIGFNYHAHRAEMNSKPADWPPIFIRSPQSVVASEAPLLRPSVSDNFDFEGELACVIGKPGRHISKALALDHVFGYSIFNDGSIRDFQTTSVTAGKNFDSSGAFGPWIVDVAEAPAWDKMTLVTRLNAEIVQQTTTDLLIFGVPDLIAYISKITKLLPGDIVSTGTPSGIGWHREPPLWMKPGDNVEVEISGIGVLANSVAAETA